MHHTHHIHHTQPLQGPPISQPMQTSQPRLSEPAMQYGQQQGSLPYHSPQDRKRRVHADIVEPMGKKRWKGTEDGSSGSYAWPGLMGTAADSQEDSEQSYFERRSISQYDPATPPLDSGPLQVSISSSPFHFPSHYVVTAQRRNEQGYSFTSRLTTRDEGVRNDMDIEASCSQLQSAHEGVTIRSLSPAPSSPSGSIHECGDYEGSAHSNHSHHQTPKPDQVYFENDEHSLLDRRRAPNGRSNFVMGFRPGCERCQRREKGHFAHFE
ncbi:hypothetical protein B0O80DRAFT_193566 [Mortierella sp. GBAus27b]|nr:hypothetical protein B0O80DRAFT_193566 [Mortierella sp. GBAus27b]